MATNPLRSDSSEAFGRTLAAHHQPKVPTGSAATPAYWLWLVFALGTLTSALLMLAAGLKIELLSPSNVPYVIAGLLVLAVRSPFAVRRLPHGRKIADLAGYYSVFAAIALMGAVTSYPIAALSHGYADAWLQRIDVALHFDWLAWYRLVAEHPMLQWAGVIAYESIYLTPAILLGWFGWHGDRDAARRFLASFWVAAAVTLTLFALMPAVGPFSYLWQGSIPYMPRSELWQPDLIPALRARSVHVVDLGQLRGIVSAPSFHAAAATLYSATAWRIARLRRPLLILNAAMLLSTPVEGTHYLSDILIGMAVAVGAMWLVNRLFDRGYPRGDALKSQAAPVWPGFSATRIP